LKIHCELHEVTPVNLAS